ncbi:HAMP domain-containing histidine kinase [Marivirga sp. S37H4]|uniref:histidine kinase n=1 Tax=Marivirga aurantiaca TaxID=2802615 RepID=A0A934WWP7_9BACT|nr:HAMP domain-containing sensor histidine kinase [Marivirga aurantiaca]MBK6264332.1 HAMP domain-containing histidine kinase [Marivirga aurantiaca]
MFKYFKLYNWSGIDKTLQQKPNIFLSQFSIIAIIACLIQIVNDTIYINYVAILLDLIVLLIPLTALILNEKHKHMPAKLVFTVLGTTVLFLYAAVIPKEIGVYLLFFPILTIIFLIFNNEQRIFKYGTAAFAISLLAILEITHYQPFGQYNVTDGLSVESSFYVNLAISVFIMVFSMYNIDVINRQIEQVRLDAEIELKQKNLDLKQANEELDHFVYSASHDLKAPLSSILGLINIAKYEVKEDKAMDYFGRIEDRIQRLTKFIKEVIAISRNTRTQVEKTEVNLNELIHDIVENNNYVDSVSNIEITRKTQVNHTLLLDKPRLEVVLNNLISNAIKYQDPGKENPRVIISSKISDDMLEISIADNGIGIAADQHDKIFEMFYRGEQSKEGSGLGLYIVKNMIQKLKGNIMFSSKVGEGTEIIIRLPVTQLSSLKTMTA